MQPNRVSRASSPMPNPVPPLHVWERHPYATGALLATPIAALYGAYHKPINRFACNLCSYIGRVNKNVFNAVRTTPFAPPAPNQTKATNGSANSTVPKPNPTPRVSSGNPKYDKQHPNTLNNKDY